MKKLLCLCFAIALIFALAIPAFAQNYLTSIQITGVSTPQNGALPGFGATLGPAETAQAAVVANLTWMDLSTDSYMNTGTEVFRYGGSYRLEITVLITDGSTIWAEGGISASINGMRASCYRIDDVYAIIEMDFTLDPPAAHTCSGGYATCTEAAICSICGEPYGQPDPTQHEPANYPKADRDPKKATHHDLKCTLCGKLLGEDAHKFGEVNGQNERPCIYCWYVEKVSTEPDTPDNPAGHTHTGGTATCSKGPVCTVCGKEYGKPDENLHELLYVKKAETDPKYTTHHDLQCQQCGKTVREEAHTLGEENGMGVKPCIYCWYAPKAELEEHDCSGGTATCHEKACCSICGEPYGELDKTAHTYLDTWGYYDETGHAKFCINCGEQSPIEAHVPAADNPEKCSLCDYPLPAEETTDGTDSPGNSDTGDGSGSTDDGNDGDGAPIKKRLKPGAIVAISAGGVAVAGGASAGTAVIFRRRRIRK